MTGIYSPVPDGSGACIIHRALCRYIQDYRIKPFNPKLALFPILLQHLSQNCRILHTLPECGDSLFQRAEHIVVTLHNFYIDDEYITTASQARKIYYRSILRPLVTRSLRHADKIVAVSDYTATLTRNFFPDREVIIIKNGVDERIFYPPKERENHRTRILFSGNPSQRKGRKILLQLADELPVGTELIVTTGLRNNGGIKHRNIHLIDRIDHEQMADLYRSVDILLLPSYREGLSLAVLEAMASGLPVVVFDTSSMAEIIDDQKGGYLCPVNDLQGMITALKRLVANKELRIDQGYYNRERITAQFTERRMINEYNQIFDSLSSR